MHLGNFNRDERIERTMEQVPARHGKICLVFDNETLPEGLDRVSPEIKRLYDTGGLEIIKLVSSEHGRVISVKGVSVRFVSTWEILAETIQLQDVKTLHITVSNTWSTLSAVELFRKWQEERKIKVIVNVLNSKWDISVLKQCNAVVVHSPEARLRLLGNGLMLNQVVVVPRYIQFSKPTPRSQRLMLRKAYGLTEGPLLFAKVVNEQLVQAVGEHWHIITPDISAPQSERITRVDVSGFEVERGFLRSADALLYQEVNTQQWYLTEAIEWSLAVFTNDSLEIEDLRPVVTFSNTFDDLILQLNGYAKEVLTDQHILRDQWFSTRTSLECSQAMIKIYDDVWSAPFVTTLSDCINLPKKVNRPIRILMQNRPNADECPGGDTVVMNRLADVLRKNGVQVDINHGHDIDYSRYDLVHLFNFALPEVLEGYARKAIFYGKQFVVTALNEDIPNFYLQGQGFASHLIDYVRQGQLRFTWDRESRLASGNAPRFRNDWVVGRAAQILTCGSVERASIMRDYSNAKVAEVKFGVDQTIKGNSQTMEQVYGIKDYILCVGRLEFRKNQLALLKALEHTDHILVFATGGFSYSPEYDEACRKFKRRGRTIFLERLSSQDLADVYQGAKIHALPSWYELPGLVTLEAASHGCEIVVSDRGTIRDYVGDMAHYCEADDVESIRKAIERAYQNPKGQNPKGAELRKIVEALTWDESGRSLLAVYENVINGCSIQEERKPLPETQQSLVFQPSLKDSSAQRATDLNPIPQEEVVEYETKLASGEAAAKVRDYLTAEKDLAKAIALSGGTSRSHRALGAVYLAQQKNHDAVIEFEKAIKVDKDDGRTLCGYGMSLLAVGRVREAHNYLLRSAQQEPYEIVTIYHIIQTSHQLEQTEDLITVLTKYCEYKKDDLEMKYCLAGALFNKKEYIRANHENEEILRQKPDHIGALELKVQLQAKLPSVTNIIETNINPHEKDILVKQAQILTSFDENDMKLLELEECKRRRDFPKVIEGINALLKYSSLRPDQIRSAELLGAEAVLLSGQIEDGLSAIKSIFDRYQDDPKVVCSYAATLCYKNEWLQAVELFQRALRMNPQSDVALAGLGGCFQQRGETENAWNNYKRALEINVECKRALLGLIQIGHETRRFTELESYLKDYLDLHPADIDFLYAMAGCLFAQERYDEAREQLYRIRIFDADNERMSELLLIIDERVGTSDALGGREYISKNQTINDMQ